VNLGVLDPPGTSGRSIIIGSPRLLTVDQRSRAGGTKINSA
jgi:hypothetical protein